ncbi:DUF169 domain-containing protein [bacterium]|nr:DUF169 domain-containing protein [bacterium]
METKLIREKAILLRKKIGLRTFPVGVKFIFISDEKNNYRGEKLKGYRYCQAFMKARNGQHIIIEEIACPAASAAFGIKELPEGLKTGKGLVGFGITKEIETGKNMFEKMPKFQHGIIKSIYLFPLETAEVEPDVVVIEDEVEKLMWIILAEVNRTKGRRVLSETAVLQAVCVDSTVLPFVKQRFNMSFGCYGCREATDIKEGEGIVGFPFKYFKEIVNYIEFLSQKAIPNSRSKSAYLRLKRVENK